MVPKSLDLRMLDSHLNYPCYDSPLKTEILQKINTCNSIPKMVAYTPRQPPPYDHKISTHKSLVCEYDPKFQRSQKRCFRVTCTFLYCSGKWIVLQQKRTFHEILITKTIPNVKRCNGIWICSKPNYRIPEIAWVSLISRSFDEQNHNSKRMSLSGY